MPGRAVNVADAGMRVVSPMVELAEASFGAYVTYAGVSGDGATQVAAFGDGTLRWTATGEAPETMATAHTFGAIPLSGAPDVDGRAALIGTDDGRLLRFDPDGRLDELAAVSGAWIENIVTHAETGLRAFSVNRDVHVLGRDGASVQVLENHPSTPAGLAFAPDGDRLAVARYDGVSVWTIGRAGKAEALYWHGSHTAVSWSPDGRFIVTAMQDNEMHCWRMPDGKSMRMSGYPRKIRALSWTPDSAFVAASGADTVTSWCCAGDGPAGKAPREFGYAYQGAVTRVAARPVGRVIAGGYADGTVMIGGVADGDGDAIIARAGDGDAVTALAWSPDGRILVAGGAWGALAVIRVPDTIG